MAKIPVSLQMYSLRDDAQKDFAATLAEVAKVGYTGIELAGYGNLDANAAAEAMRAVGLQCSGMHVGLDLLRNQFTQVVTEAKLFGTKHVICPFFPPALLDSRDAFIGLGRELDTIGEHLAAFGLQLHYHNHDGEMRTFDGQTGFEWLLDVSRPAHLACEPDVFWVHKGGQDPAAFLRAQGRRTRLVHLKDEKEIGGGPVDFAAVFAAIDALPSIEWLVVEVEHYDFAPLESVRRSFEQLQAWGRA